MCLSMSQVVAWKVTWKHNLSAIDGWPITVCCKPHLSCRKTCFFHANRGQQRTKITWYQKNTSIFNTKHVAICCSRIFDAKTHIPSIKYHLGTAAARSLSIFLETNGAPFFVARSPKWYYGCDQKSSGFLWKTMWKTSNGTMENHTKNHPMKRFPLDDFFVVFHGSSTNEAMELDGIGTKVSCQKWSLSIREKQHYCAFRKTRKPLWHRISDHRLLDVVGCCWIKGEPEKPSSNNNIQQW